MELNGTLSLPKEPVLDNKDMRHLKVMVYGPPGIGKSTYFNQAKGVFTLSTDSGLKFISSMHRQVDSWGTFKKYVKLLQTERPKQYTAICIDLIDTLCRMCTKNVCEKRGIQHLSDEQWGKAFDIAQTEFEAEMEKLFGLTQYGLFIVSHSKEVERKTRFSSLTKLEPTIPKQGFKIIYPVLDILAYYGFDSETGSDDSLARRMYFQPTETMEAKDRTGLLPESIRIPPPAETNGFEMVEKYLLGTQTIQNAKKKILIKHK